eukprot:scaffold220302_cov18-Tisochrysis_lutea.AAC.2
MTHHSSPCLRLQEGQQYSCYKVTISSVGHQQARACLSFLLFIAAVPPAPIAWRWQLKSHDLGVWSRSPADAGEEGSSEVKLPLALPLAHMLTPQAVDRQGGVREAVLGTQPMVSITPLPRGTSTLGNSGSSGGETDAAMDEEVQGGLGVQLARLGGSGSSRSEGSSGGSRSEGSSLQLLGRGPVSFCDSLCLVGATKSACLLQVGLTGGGMSPVLPLCLSAKSACCKWACDKEAHRLFRRCALKQEKEKNNFANSPSTTTLHKANDWTSNNLLPACGCALPLWPESVSSAMQFLLPDDTESHALLQLCPSTSSSPSHVLSFIVPVLPLNT